ncbi:PAS domain S-box protein [bacterium]|nr:MAG: PAS domain S-box protein [bacterium]
MEMNYKEQIVQELIEKGVFDALGDGISIQDTKYKILYQNSVHISFVGNHVGEYCYKAYEKRKDRCKGCPLAETFKDGKIHTKDRSAPTDKGTIYVEITTSPIKVPTGEIIAGIEIVRDVTERKLTDMRLRESELKFRMIFEKAPIGILHFQQNGDVTDCNEKFAEIIGAPKEKVTDFNLLKQLKDKHMKAAIEDTLGGGLGHYEGEYTSVVGKKTTPIRADFGPIFSEDGEIIEGIGIFEDITERSKMDKELKNRIKELEVFYNLAIKREHKIRKLEEENEKLKFK